MSPPRHAQVKLSTSRVLGLIQIGADSDYPIEALRRELSNTFRGLRVTILTQLFDVSEAFDTRRDQYHSTRILVILEEQVERKAADLLLGLTAYDLFVPGMNFVFGEARCPGRAAVISTRRLKQSPSTSYSRALRGRVLKEAVHEMGHMFGLKHCSNVICVMHFSEHIGDTDRKKATFCLECQAEMKRERLE